MSKNKTQVLADLGLNPFAYQLVCESVSRHAHELSHVELIWHHFKDKTKQVRITVEIEDFKEGPLFIVVKDKDGKYWIDNRDRDK